MGADSDMRGSARAKLAASSLTVLLCWVVLLWPSIVNGGALLFVDTTAYVRGVDAGVHSIAGLSTDWSLPGAEGEIDNGNAGTQGSPIDQAEVRGEHIVLAGRSLYYGALPYLSYLLSQSFWPVVLVQSLLVALATSVTVFRFAGAGPGSRAVCFLVPLVLLATAAPYFASFVMPDIFVALAVIALGNIVAFWERDGVWLRTFWGLLLAYGALSHSATLLLIGASASIGVVLALAGYVRVPKAAAGAVAAAVLAGIVGEVVFSMAVRELTGHAPVRPPFLTARIVDDGPGYRHLQETCPGSGFVLCRLIDRPPVNSDVFLWSSEPGKGSFLSGSAQEAQQLSAEQGRFVLAVFQARPGELVQSSLGAVGRQMGMIHLSEFNYEKSTREHFDRKLPAVVKENVARTAAYRGLLPTAVVPLLVLPLALASLAIIAASCARARRPGRVFGPATLLALTLVAGIVLNVVISGAISTPHDRYSMRTLWLLPVLALALLPIMKRSATRKPSKTGMLS